MSNAGIESREERSPGDSPADTVPHSNPTDPPTMLMTLPSSGSSEENVTQYVDNYVSQTEATQYRSYSEMPTADKVITNVIQTEVSGPQLTISVDEPPVPSNAAVLRNLLGDSDSDVLSLGEITKLPSPRPLFPETEDNPVAASGESCFRVLHELHQLRGQVGDYYAESTDGDQAGTSKNYNTVLNSLDSFPHLRRLTGPSQLVARTKRLWLLSDKKPLMSITITRLGSNLPGLLELVTLHLRGPE